MTDSGKQKDRGQPEYEGPRSPVRVMQIVEALAEAESGLPLTALASRLSIPKTSALNHLRVMVRSGHVAMNNGRYVLGPASVRLGIIIASASSGQASIEPIANELAQQGGETALIGMLDREAREAVYVCVFQGSQPIRYVPTVGTRRPLYSAAIGRVLLAFQDEPYISSYLRSTKRIPITPKTETDRKQLARVLTAIRINGQATTNGMHLEGVGGIASPVFDRDGKVRYAIGVGVPTHRLDSDSQRLTRLVFSAAKKASWALGAPTVERP